MAFHVACPITCRKICFCTLGAPWALQSPQGRESFLQDVLALENLLAKPAFLAAGGEETVEVLVPRLAKDLKAKKKKNIGGQSGWESGEETPISLSKKAVMRKKATMAAIAVAEAAALAEQAKKAAEAARLGAARQLAETRVHSNGSEAIAGAPQVTCELCFFGEVTGSKKADRMIACPGCKKRYHRNCLKRWAGNRDLFNWSSWVCGSCRICEVCRRTGEPNKLMFCKRCDGAYHAYCQQPPLKQVPKGPFLCPKHTVCHSCAARVPGSGVSSRWFLGYTTCDACGRLFMRGKYCPICLKVYRDSEASAMVCCDNCEHWVHCQCDGISDEKYREFQLDNNLHYTCAACRGDCYQVKDMDDAADVLWRRRDEAERDIVSRLQAAAGLPPKDESPSSDNDEDDHVVHVEDRLLKKTIKVQPLKGKDREGKSSKKQDLGKKKIIKVEKGGTAGNIKKLKITLPKADIGKPQVHTELNSIADGRATSAVEGRIPITEKVHKKNNGSVVKLIKLADHKTRVGEFSAPGNERKDAISLADRRAPGNTMSDTRIIATSEKMNAKKLKSKKNSKKSDSKKTVNALFEKGSLENHVKMVKFVSSADNLTGTKVVLHLPSKEKGNKNKVKMKFPAVLTSTEDSLEAQRGSNQFQSDAEETESEGPYNLEAHGHEERDGVQDLYTDKDGDTLEDASQIHAWGANGEISRRRRVPSLKYRDMDTSVRKSIKVSKESLNSSEKRGNSFSTRLDNITANEAVEYTDSTSGRGGIVSITLDRERRERERGLFDAASAMSQDEDSSGVPRKRLKVLDLGRKSEEEEGNGTKDSISKVSLKLKFKKPVGEKSVQPGDTERVSPRHGSSAIRGQRSKRRKHHLLEPGKLTDHEQEGNLHVTLEEDGKISDDSWILQKLGKDAVDKRVEVFRPRDRLWYKGTVTEVLPLKSQFVVSSDEGRQETIEFGKRSVRILSHSKKHPRS